MKETTQERTRRPYSTPELWRVELKPEETLSTGCKVNSTPGGGPANINDCITDNFMMDFGS